MRVLHGGPLCTGPARVTGVHAQGDRRCPRLTPSSSAACSIESTPAPPLLPRLSRLQGSGQTCMTLEFSLQSGRNILETTLGESAGLPCLAIRRGEASTPPAGKRPQGWTAQSQVSPTSLWLSALRAEFSISQGRLFPMSCHLLLFLRESFCPALSATVSCLR